MCELDLRNTDMNSESFMRKLQRAQEALSQSQSDSSSIKTLSASFGQKWPYKRTMSAPASMVPRQDTKQGISCENYLIVYCTVNKELTIVYLITKTVVIKVIDVNPLMYISGYTI